jgi:flagellar assembly protein FliH
LSSPAASAAFRFEPLDAPPPGYDDPPAVRAGQAHDILATARAEAETIRESARQEGFEAGFQAGLAHADQRVKPIVAALGEAHAALGAERERSAEAVERHAVDLGLRIAEKALGAAIAADPELVVDVVRGALRRLLERDRVQVLVHPEDLELVRDATGKLKQQLGGIGELDVQAERRVARGGAIVRTQSGEVDARLETQLDRARETLLEALSASPDEGHADPADHIFG